MVLPKRCSQHVGMFLDQFAGVGIASESSDARRLADAVQALRLTSAADPACRIGTISCRPRTHHDGLQTADQIIKQYSRFGKPRIDRRVRHVPLDRLLEGVGGILQAKRADTAGQPLERMYCALGAFAVVVGQRPPGFRRACPSGCRQMRARIEK